VPWIAGWGKVLLEVISKHLDSAFQHALVWPRSVVDGQDVDAQETNA
jgi:hypothetical protein